MNPKRILKRYFFPLLISFVFIYFLSTTIDFTESIRKFSGIRIYPFVISFFIYMIQYLFLALRWRFLCGGIIGLDSFYYVTSIHNMTNNLMPMRTGELIYPYLLKRYFNVGLGDSAAYLIFARIFDLIAMGVFFFFSILLTRDKITLFFGDIKAESLKFLLYLVILILVLGVIYWIFSKITESEKTEGRYLVKTLKNGWYKDCLLSY